MKEQKEIRILFDPNVSEQEIEIAESLVKTALKKWFNEDDFHVSTWDVS